MQGMGYASALGVLSRAIPVPDGPNAIPLTGFGYLASAGDRASPADGVGASGIHVFEVHGDHWNWKQSIPSLSPASLTLHPNQRVLYVANEVDEHENLPRGTVEAYKIHAHDGSLTPLNRQPLSLSGVKPRHVAVSPDGKYLVVAIHGGGAYNVLPIAFDGTLGRVSQILKEVGAGSHPDYQASAHPHTLMFDATGQHLLATDEGCDRLSVFAFQNGRMMRTGQAFSQPVSGPGQLASHPSGELLYVSNTFDGSIDCYRWHADVGRVEHQQRVMTSPKTAPCEARYLAISSSGRFLYTAFANEGISVWEIDPVTGKISVIQQGVLTNRSFRALILSPDNRRLFVSDAHQHELLSMPVHTGSGKLGTAFTIAATPSPGKVVIKYVRLRNVDSAKMSLETIV